MKKNGVISQNKKSKDLLGFYYTWELYKNPKKNFTGADQHYLEAKELDKFFQETDFFK